MKDPKLVKESVHYVLTQLLAGTLLDTVLDAGDGKGHEAWRRLTQELDPRGATRMAGSIMAILRFHFSAVTSSCEQVNKLIREHVRRTGKGLDDDVKTGIAIPTFLICTSRPDHPCGAAERGC